MSLSKTEPTVCAIMLTADRPELARRAVECFRRQTYPAKRMMILDTGKRPCGLESVHCDQIGYFDCSVAQREQPRTIGELRNMASECAISTDILIHWDDDDWSHPNRIAEQVALLQSSGADCVGYREMLFWREESAYEDAPACYADAWGKRPAQAWLYSNPNHGYALGTSLCYWRKTWERKPFAATSQGEDLQFITGLKVSGVPSIGAKIRGEPGEPRMIARIHGGNTSTAYSPRKMEAEAKAANPVWRRVPEWDTHCRSIMEEK